MTLASGPQIAFLVFAVQFFAMLGARALAPRIGWPPDEFMLLGQLFSFAIASAILFGTPALRRYCITELGRPPASGMSLELLMVSLSKGAIPFAIVGATVLWAFASGSVAEIADRIRVVDATRAWGWILSPYGLASVVLLSWLVGPVIEELVFRGLLYRAFERQWGWIASTAVTSLLFGLMHPSHMAATALGSVVLVCVLRRTGSLPACIFVHAAFNMIISWPVLGQLLFATPPGDPMRISSWTFHIACLGFVSSALPAYLLMSLRDARAPATP